MDIGTLINQLGALWSPLTFSILAGLAVLMVWTSLAPAAPRRDVTSRLDDYLDRGDIVIEEVLRQPFLKRAVWPGVQSILRLLARLLPNRNLESTRHKLQQAGSPGGLSLSCTHKSGVIELCGEACSLSKSFELEPASPQSFPARVTVTAPAPEAAQLGYAAPELAERDGGGRQPQFGGE